MHVLDVKCSISRSASFISLSRRVVYSASPGHFEEMVSNDPVASTRVPMAPIMGLEPATAR